MGQDIRIYPTASRIEFSGSVLNSIYLQVLQSGSVSYFGTSGSLLSIDDKLTGSLFSVNDISGLPLFEVKSDQTIVAGAFTKNDFVVSGSSVGVGTGAPTAKFEVVGAVKASSVGIAAAPSVTEVLYVQGNTQIVGNTYLNGAISASSAQTTVTATTTGHAMYGWLNLYIPGVGLKLIQLWT